MKSYVGVAIGPGTLKTSTFRQFYMPIKAVLAGRLTAHDEVEGTYKILVRLATH